MALTLPARERPAEEVEAQFIMTATRSPFLFVEQKLRTTMPMKAVVQFSLSPMTKPDLL